MRPTPGITAAPKELWFASTRTHQETVDAGGGGDGGPPDMRIWKAGILADGGLAPEARVDLGLDARQEVRRVHGRASSAVDAPAKCT